MAFPSTAAPERVAARLHVGAGGDFILFVAKDSGEPVSALGISFEMPNNVMPTIVPEALTVVAGGFRATGRLAMPGHWRLRILRGTEPEVFDFILAEF